MEMRLGRFPADCERPEPLKFAWPIVLLPEIFTTVRHLTVLRGYLANIGWEIYTPDLRALDAPSRKISRGHGFDDLAGAVAEAIDALERDAVIVGHGLGGLLALKAAEHPRVRAAVALAPMVPGRSSRLWARPANLPAMWFGRPLRPPRGSALFRLLADAEPFQRQALADALVADRAQAAMEVRRGRAHLGSAGRLAPRLVVAGDRDPFVPLDAVARFAAGIDATLKVVPGRGHWLVGGRALERTMAEMQRFLVRRLGSDLLLLYREEWKDED